MTHTHKKTHLLSVTLNKKQEISHWTHKWHYKSVCDLLHSPLHSLRAPDVLYFALFFCRGKQLGERERQDTEGRLVAEGELDLTVLTALSGLSFTHLILSTACLNWPSHHKKVIDCAWCLSVQYSVRSPEFWCFPLLSPSSLHPLSTDHYGFIVPLDCSRVASFTWAKDTLTSLSTRRIIPAARFNTFSIPQCRQLMKDLEGCGYSPKPFLALWKFISTRLSCKQWKARPCITTKMFGQMCTTGARTQTLLGSFISVYEYDWGWNTLKIQLCKGEIRWDNYSTPTALQLILTMAPASKTKWFCIFIDHQDTTVVLLHVSSLKGIINPQHINCTHVSSAT